MGEHIFKMIIDANDQVAGLWRGGQIGAMSFLYEAATGKGVALDSTSALR